MRLGFALLGSPVAHSLSPRIHRTAFDALGLEASYEAVEVEPTELEAAIRFWASRGGGNVTLPYKRRAAALLDRASESVVATGACNCFWRTGADGLAGDNTDVGGILAALDELRGEEAAEGGRVLLLGAGGAARAAFLACVRSGVAAVEVRNRTPARARRLVEDLAPPGLRVEVGEWGRPPRRAYDLAIQATRLGLEPSDPLPPAPEGTRIALDLVYARGETRWVREMRAAGARAADGLGVLVHQAALSLRRWLPDADPPVDAMRRAAEEALGR